MPVSERGLDQALSPISDHQAQSAPVPWPPSYDSGKSSSKWDVPYQPWVLPLPLWETALPCPFAAAAARVQAPTSAASMIVLEFGIGKEDMAAVYMSLDPFYEAFEKELDLCKWSFDRHCTAGLSLLLHNGHLYLGRMTPSSPGAKVDKWRIHLCGTWLIRIGSSTVSTIAEAQTIFKALYDSGTSLVTLLFSHLELRWDISNKGLPIILLAPFSQQTHNQLNRQWDFTTNAKYLRKAPPYKIVDSGHVLNYVTWVMKLTRGKLL